MYNVLKKVIKELYKYNTKYEHCNRDICVCIYQLDMNKIEHYEYYKKCYKSWNTSTKHNIC
jgi:hypothetical protein